MMNMDQLDDLRVGVIQYEFRDLNSFMAHVMDVSRTNFDAAS